jgi:hypothetical protein
MRSSQRCRHNAAECLIASREARQPHYRKLNFSLAAFWLALAGRDDAVDRLLANWNMPESMELPKVTAVGERRSA